jgi:hypothetical protein
MKRLMIAMVALTALYGGPMSGQSKDIAGTWLLDAEKSATKDGPPMVILSLTSKELEARFGNEKARAMTFTLDGVEQVTSEGAKTKAAWKGSRLEATVTMPGREAETVVFSRDGSWLVVDVSMKERGAQKLYFKKAPAK